MLPSSCCPKIKHYEHTPMQYLATFHGCKNDNFQMKRTTCIRQGFWPPLKPNIGSYFSTISLDCFVRRMTKVFIFHNDLTS